MKDLTYFYNDGFGWVCRSCELEIDPNPGEKVNSRLMNEGEAESKTPQFSNLALAKWADAAQTILVCPRCGITETVDAR